MTKATPTEQKVHELLDEFINLYIQYQRAYKDFRDLDWDPEEEQKKLYARANEIQNILIRAIEKGGFE
jgi:hypothetical protein